jgi:hypothetical protein
MCRDFDESTTNQISRIEGSILICDLQKSLPIRLERIPDATVPIGTNLFLGKSQGMILHLVINNGTGNVVLPTWMSY